MPLRVLVFGNPLLEDDSAALCIAKKLEGTLADVQFVRFDTSEDLEKEGENPVILDVILGIRKPRLIGLSEILLQKPYSLHDFDLGWNLLLLKKLGKIKNAAIVGVPAKKPTRETVLIARKLLLSLL